MVTEFKSSIYNKYICTLSRHITQQFPDINLIEGFEIFNPKGIPQELALQPSHGSDSLDTFISHCSPHNVVHAESTKEELKIFNSVIAANSTLKQEEMNMMFLIYPSWQVLVFYYQCPLQIVSVDFHLLLMSKQI